MNIELMVQNLVADIASVPQTGSDTGAEGTDFDTLLRQQTKTNQPQRPAEKPKDKQPAQKPKAKEDSTQDEITEDGYQVAAGLVTSQPVVHFELLPVVDQDVQAVASVEGEGVRPELGLVAEVLAPQEEALPQQAVVEAVRPQEAPFQQAAVEVAEPEALPQEEQPEAVQEVEPQQEASVEAEPQRKESVHVVSSQSAQVEEEQPEDVDVQEAWTGRSLFQRDSAVPVKVADNYEPIPLEEEGGDAQLSANLREAMDQGLSRVELQLSPASLGNLTVEITRDQSGQISIVFRPETARAAALLNNADLSTLMLNKDGSYNLSMKAVVTVMQPQQPEQNQNQFLNPDGQNQQRQQQEQKEKKHKGASEEFLHQLRLGLVGLED